MENEIRWLKHQLKGTFYGKDRRLIITNVAGRQLQPQKIKEHKIAEVETLDDSRTIKMLQLNDEEKVIEGEVELFHSFLWSEPDHPQLRFNGVFVGYLDISPYSHPRRKEFWYDEDHRAPFAEMLRECHNRKIRIILPSLLHFDPKSYVDKASVYCDLPTAAEVKNEYPQLKL